MRKCGKVKNPCRICFTSVSKKNGLHCSGACKRWMHYKCMNLTPGKIQDIKAGLVKINCPCPDCDFQPKEEYIRRNVPFTCDTVDCPAKKPTHQCEVPLCPKNDTEIQTDGPYDCPADCTPQEEIKAEPCRKRQLRQTSPAIKSKDCTTSCPSTLPKKESKSSQYEDIPQGTQRIRTQFESKPKDLSPVESLEPKQCSPGLVKKSQRAMDGLCSATTCPFKMRQLQMSKPDCRNDNYKRNTNMLPNIRGSKSVCSTMTAEYTREHKPVNKSVSDYHMMTPSETRKVMLNAIAQMCCTVGQFTNQFKELVNKLMTNLDKEQN